MGQVDYPVTARYLIEYKNKQWLLSRDGEFLHAAPEPLFVFGFLIENLVPTLVNRAHNHVVFHAAGLAHHQHGLILCGESGSGKSTLAACLTGEGFDFLTDELLAFTPDNDLMSGIPLPLVLQADSHFVKNRYLPPNSPDDFPDVVPGVMWLDPYRLRANSVTRSATPRWLVFPRYQANAPLQVNPVSAGRATFQLVQRVVNEVETQHNFAIASRIARQTEAYQLVYGDMDEALTWFESWQATAELLCVNNDNGKQ